MIDYATAQREFPKLKAALTRAKKSGDHKRVIAECEKAMQRFDAWGAWPDDWRLWERAKEDAEMAIRLGR